MPGPLKWNQDGAIALRNFIRSHPVFLDALKKAAPKVTGGTVEESAMTGRERQGYEKCMEEIENLQRDQGSIVDDPGFIPNDKP